MHPATLVHRNDPETSAISAERVSKRGTAKRNRALLVELVTAREGLTYEELADVAKNWPGGRFSPLAKGSEIGRRMSEAKAEGKLFYGQRRRCRINGTMCSTLYRSREEANGQKVLF